jgi:GAF domain-containing protein
LLFYFEINELETFLIYGLGFLVVLLSILLIKKKSYTPSDSDMTGRINEVFEKILEEEKILSQAKFSEDNFNSSFEKFSRLIGEGVEAEVLILGRIEEEQMVDKGFYTSFARNKECEKAIQNVLRIKVKDSLVYPFIKTDGEYNSSINTKEKFSENLIVLQRLKLYENKILRSKKIKQVYSKGLFVDGKLFGYLIAINKDNEIGNFSKEDIQLMKNSSLLLNNYYTAIFNERLITNQEKDDAFFQELYLLNNIETILSKSLKYLNSEFESFLASYWMLGSNGPKKEEKILLARFFEVAKGFENFRDEILENLSGPSSESIIGDLLENGISVTEDIEKLVPVYDLKKGQNGQIWNFLPDSKLIVLPVLKSKPSQNTRSVSKLLGTICLRLPKDSKVDLAVLARLVSFSQTLQAILERSIFEFRFRQIERLKSLENEILQLDDQENLYASIVNVLKRVSLAEECSVFISDPKYNSLFLRATSAHSFYQMNDERGPVFTKAETLIKNRTPLYSLDLKKDFSYSSWSFNYKRSVNIYNVWDQKKANLKAMEYPSESHHHESVLIIPLKDLSGKPFGVFRFINKRKEKKSLFHHFSDTDLDMLEIACSYISTYINLRENGDALTSTLAKIGHEARQPLFGVKQNFGILEMLFRIKKINHDDINGILQNMRVELNVIQQNINNIDMIYRTHEYQYQFEPTDISELIKSIVKVTNESNLIKPYFEDFPKLYLDRSKMTQVINNLISNAQRYAPKEKLRIIGHTGFFYVDGNEYLKIDFIDNGIGISDGDKNRIFDEINYRGENAIKNYPAGSGLGLKIVKSIIANHDGLIKVTSLKSPTVFSIFLPSYLMRKSPKQ